MSETALLLVLGAAFAHATWNLLAKVAGGGAAFVWMCTLANVVIWAPLVVVILVLTPDALPTVGLALIVGSGVLHTGYWLSLNRGYRDGDLSLVYPLARGIGSLLAALAAVALFAERPTPLAAIGAGLIVAAVFFLARGDRMLRRRRSVAGVSWAVTTGVFIAAYTLWDSRAVGPLDVQPLVFYWAVNVINTLLITPYVLRRGLPPGLFHDQLGRASCVGVLSTLSYVPILYALAIAPVSIVAPAREVSVLLGAAMGIQILSESDARRRLVSAGAMVAGIAALALG